MLPWASVLAVSGLALPAPGLSFASISITPHSALLRVPSQRLAKYGSHRVQHVEAKSHVGATRSSNRLRVAVMTSPKVERVAVVGGGIGGLTLAIALQALQTGVKEVQVFERSTAIIPGIGGGVQINSGAVVLGRLGLGDTIKAAGNRVKRILSRTVGGRVILDLDIDGIIASDPKLGDTIVDDGTPMLFTFMRDHLLQILADRVAEGTINFSREVTRVDETATGTFLSFSDGSTAGPFDLVVGADGIKGPVRAVMETSKGRPGWGQAEGQRKGNKPLYSGIRIQFGVAPAGQRPSGAEEEVHQWFGGDTYGLTATYGGMGDKKYEMLWAVYPDSSSKGENTAWDAINCKDSYLQRLEERGFPLEVTMVAKASERYFELGVHYRNPLQPWVGGKEGQVVLLGDAAHAMPPNLGQGANQAIQDAYCLAECIRELNLGGYDRDVGRAMHQYESMRKPTTTSLLAKSAIVGGIETLQGPLGEAFRDNFFFGMWKTGIAGKMFFDGTVPKV
ncbi:unnamed protein product [Discosporangium mesarthrocarpum]